MQNKRGISQAMSPTASGIALRRATVFDVFDISRILVQSITLLCRDDHRDDPRALAEWTSGKTAQDIRKWLDGDAEFWLAEWNGQPGGVGAISSGGEVLLLYVAPSAIGQGIGAALLDRLEDRLRDAGHQTGFLVGTTTARAFYEARGWRGDGAARCGPAASCQAMTKQL